MTAAQPSATEPDGAKRRRERLERLRRYLKWAGLGLAALTVVGIISVVIVIERLSVGLPSVEQLRQGYRPPQLTRIFARNGTVLANVFVERRTVIPFDSIPSHVKLAFLAAEDATFYEHEGLNYVGMLRALVVNLRSGAKRQGGSTITQQVVKNVLLDSERTYRRKVRETILARRLEQHLTKDEIFSLYLNHIYLGHGRYGVEEASRYYFGRSARNINLAEAALLAGMVAAPERYSPRLHPEKALERREFVLLQMQKKAFITPALHSEAKNEAARLAPAVEAESELSPEAVHAARRKLTEVAGEAAAQGGFDVTTTIDPQLQAAARKAVRDNLDAYAKRHDLDAPYTLTRRPSWGEPFTGRPKAHRVHVGVVEGTNDQLGSIDVRVGSVVGRVFLAQETRYNPQGLSPSKFAAKGALLRVSLLHEPEGDEPPPLRLELGPQSALVAIDVRTRDVVALVGSYEGLAGGLDRATQARRQPGSAFKPFVYSYALHSRRFTPASVLELPNVRRRPDDTPTRLINLRDAVARSDNAAAVRVQRDIGPAHVVEWAHAAGIDSRLEPDASLALGAYEVTPLEVANAYATFATGGVYSRARLISRIAHADGRPLTLPQEPPVRRVMQPDEAYLTTSLLRSVVEEGTGRKARSLARPLAGKTGTTNDEKDAWFVGYSTDFVVAVWVGYDDGLPLGAGESGAAAALPAWVDFMKAAHQGKAVTEFARPGNIVVARVDPATGLLAPGDLDGAREEEFLAGTEPTETSPEPEEALQSSGDAGAPKEVAAPEKPAEPSVAELPPF